MLIYIICIYDANDCFEIFDPSPWRFPVQLPLLLMFNVFYFPFVADFSLMSTNWFANCNWWPGSRSRSLAPWRPRSFFFSFLQWSRTVWLVHHQHSLLPPRHPLGHLLAHQQVWLCQIFQFRTGSMLFLRRETNKSSLMQQSKFVCLSWNIEGLRQNYMSLKYFIENLSPSVLLFKRVT